MADNDVGSSSIAMNADGDAAAVGKIDHVRDGTPSSMESTPEHEAGMEATQEPAAQPQKRKGGRKPVSILANFNRFAVADHRLDLRDF